MRYAKTEWGLNVKMFTQRYGLTLKDLAASSGVNYPTLLQVIIGKTPGHGVAPKVDAFMEDYAKKNDPTLNLRPFEEVKSCEQTAPEAPTFETSRTPPFNGKSAPSTSKT